MATLTDDMSAALARQVSTIKTIYSDRLSEEFRSLGYWGKDSIQKWNEISVPMVVEAQQVTADIASASFDLQLQLLLDGEYQPFDVDYSVVTGPAIRNGVPVEEVYQRAFKPVWRGIGNGYTIDDSVEMGVSRFREMFDLDIERVVDHVAINRFANENKIVGYRRVLIGAANCALCIVASTNTYHKRELKGIHPHCNCKVSPVMSFEDSKTLDRNLLDDVHRQVALRFGVSDRAARSIDYRKILLTREHGEYGPTLTFSGHKFTGPEGLQTPGE